MLCDKKMTIATAESCTEAFLQQVLYHIQEYQKFYGGCCNIFNEAKISRLGVKEETLGNMVQ